VDLSRSAILGPIAVVVALAVPRAAADPGGYEYGTAAPEGPSSGTLLSRRNELVGAVLPFKGTVEPRFAAHTVVLQRLEPGGTWTEVARTVADAQGAFRTAWTTDHIGRFTLRAMPLPDEGSTAAAVPTASRAITVFRLAVATLFGPGLYGRRTACDRRLTRKLRGVAHRTLPCGTRVDLYYRGRTVTVPVVDRGPFRKGVSWDLTTATAKDLRLTTTDTIGAVRVRPDSAQPPATVSP